MPPLELPIALFGRRVRPVALGLLIWNLAVAWSIATEARQVGWIEHAIAVAAVVASLLFLLGWVCRSDAEEAAGLALTFFVAAWTIAWLALTVGWTPRELTTVAIAVIAAGSFWLERLLPPPPRRQRG